MIEPSTGPGTTGSQGVDLSRRWFVNRQGMHMLEVPGGTFMMGDNQDRDNKPHEVTLTRPFFMCDREVWSDLFQQFINDPNYPSSEKPQGDDDRMSPPTGKRTAAAAQIDRLTAQLAAAPDDPARLRARGMAAVNLFRDEQAVQDLTKYLEKSPADVLARHAVAVAHARLGQRHAATQAVAEIAKRAPDSSQTAYSRAVVGSIMGSDDDAIAALEQAVKAHAGDESFLYNAACAYALVAEHLEQREEGARGEGAGQEGALQDPDRAERIKRCKGRAIELLVLACDAGYSDYVHVHTDSDLESLWPLEGFHLVLARLGRIAIADVNWFDAVLFCNWLSQKEGRQPCYKRTGEKQKVKLGNEQVEWELWNCDFDVNGYRLPTEAEWEYAARAETRSSFCFGDDESLLPKYGYSSVNSKSRAWPGAMLLPNASGLFDVHGNVWEWCWDWHGELTGDQTDPVGAPAGSFRVIRGGGWVNLASYCRASYRLYYLPVYRLGHLGFRVVCVGVLSVVSSRSPLGAR
jgi:formylglycine-generating enzyme required for sulfatase activity